MEYLLNNVPQEVSSFDYAPNFGRFTSPLEGIRTSVVNAIVRLEVAREIAYDPAEDIAGMLPDLIESEDDDYE